MKVIKNDSCQKRKISNLLKLRAIENDRLSKQTIVKTESYKT